jgi:hypothetical protein
LVDAITESLLDRLGDELTPAVPPEDAELAWYVYGVIAARELELPPEISGVEPALPIGTLREGALAAVASQVPGAEFAETELRAHLADMEWVQRVARAHEAVLDEITSRATVIPMRMCTVYRTEGGVREMLRRESETLSEALEQLEGKTEWGVKVLAGASSSPGTSTSTADDRPPGDVGAAYMERKRRERADAEQAAQLIQEACAEIHEALCALSSDALLAPPQRPEAHGLDGEMVLNGVYLVRDEEEPAFHDRVEGLQEEYRTLGLQLQRTGPWPAYNFVPATLGATW